MKNESKLLIELTKAKPNSILNGCIVNVVLDGYEHEIVDMLAALYKAHPKILNICLEAVVRHQSLQSVKSFDVKPKNQN
jgi:hypothetical protein